MKKTALFFALLGVSLAALLLTPAAAHSRGECKEKEDYSGRYCREYTTEAVVGGRTKQVYGTACRQPDGSWQLVS